jgi:hypothetical protein
MAMINICHISICTMGNTGMGITGIITNLTITNIIINIIMDTTMVIYPITNIMKDRTIRVVTGVIMGTVKHQKLPTKKQKNKIVPPNRPGKRLGNKSPERT